MENPSALLCPSHGPTVKDPEGALRFLRKRLIGILDSSRIGTGEPTNFPELEGGTTHWRRVRPSVYQLRSGNNVVLISQSGNAVMIDDGMCLWLPPEERLKRHDQILSELKIAAGIRKFNFVLPSHFHGDHTEFINHLAQSENSRILATETTAAPITQPDNFNLACKLPWYGGVANTIQIDEIVPDGYILDWDGLQIEFFHLGGQTAYHSGFDLQIDGERILVVGDAWFGTDPTPKPVLCWNDAAPCSVGWLHALERMIERKPDYIVCGHGSAIENPLPLLKEARSLWSRQIERFEQLNPHEKENPFFTPQEHPFTELTK
jgi:glyoxylase-like metal-dependent hydrolase (beta-lactamase superfamily II)